MKEKSLTSSLVDKLMCLQSDQHLYTQRRTRILVVCPCDFNNSGQWDTGVGLRHDSPAPPPHTQAIWTTETWYSICVSVVACAFLYLIFRGSEWSEVVARLSVCTCTGGWLRYPAVPAAVPSSRSVPRRAARLAVISEKNSSACRRRSSRRKRRGGVAVEGHCTDPLRLG